MTTVRFKIVMVASEAVPFAKTGGLADVVGALSQVLASRGSQVFLFFPFYRSIKKANFNLRKKGALSLEIRDKKEPFRYFTSSNNGVTVYFVEKDEYYDRDTLYGTLEGDFPDNLIRFSFFCRAVLEVLVREELMPNVIHCHDWQTALLPLYLKTLYSDSPGMEKVITVFTIHNLAYQGIFPSEQFPLLGLEWKYFTPETLEFYGKVNIIKAGLVFSDALTTVSKTYAREIQTPEFGAGLHGILTMRSGELWGVLNGIDQQHWNPEEDKFISHGYSFQNLRGKWLNKKKLQTSQDLKVSKNTPLIGIVSRLAAQKGFDLIEKVMDKIMGLGFQMVILGSGEERYHSMLKRIASEYPQRIALNMKYDFPLAHQIYAGSDFFLLPSRYEPCGLGQLISLRYGTIPVVHKTGGLADTVKEFEPQTGKGNGFTFGEYSPSSLIEALQRALKIYKNKKMWENLISSVMKLDFSWDRSAQRYEEIYEEVSRRKALKNTRNG